jgi:hypothetical protein
MHPREFDPGSWHLRLPLSFSEQLIHRLRLRTTPGKILRLMREPGWQTVGEMLRQRGALGSADGC